MLNNVHTFCLGSMVAHEEKGMLMAPFKKSLQIPSSWAFSPSPEMPYSKGTMSHDIFPPTKLKMTSPSSGLRKMTVKKFIGNGIWNFITCELGVGLLPFIPTVLTFPFSRACRRSNNFCTYQQHLHVISSSVMYNNHGPNRSTAQGNQS
jgi:hypothetical protein